MFTIQMSAITHSMPGKHSNNSIFTINALVQYDTHKMYNTPNFGNSGWARLLTTHPNKNK